MITEAQRDCLQWLRDNGGEGVLDSYARVLAQGQRRSQSYTPSFLRLFTTGHIESGGPNRLRLSDLGRSATKAHGNPTNPTEVNWSEEKVRAAFIGDEPEFDHRGDEA